MKSQALPHTGANKTASPSMASNASDSNLSRKAHSSRVSSQQLTSSSSPSSTSTVVIRLKYCQQLTTEYSAKLIEQIGAELALYLSDTQSQALSDDAYKQAVMANNQWKRFAPPFAPIFQQRLSEGFIKFKAGCLNTHLSQDVQSDTAPKGAILTLVEHDELEEELQLSSLIRVANNHLIESLWAINKRFSVIGGGKRLSHNNNPVAPVQWVCAFNQLLRANEFESTSKQALLKALSSKLPRVLETLYASLNHYFINENILPNLDYRTDRLREQQVQEHHVKSHQLKASPSPNNQATSPQKHHNVNKTPHNGLSDDSANPQITQIYSLIEQKLPKLTSPIVELCNDAAQSFSSSGKAYQLSNEQVLDAISKVQSNTTINESSPEFQDKNHRTLVEQQIAKTIISQQPGGTLGQPDIQTIELVGMLFDYMLSDDQLPDRVKSVLSYLHTPYLKLAFIDPSFFSNEQHSARQLLNNLAECGCLWVNNDGSDNYNMFEKIKLFVSKVLDNFDTDIEIFKQTLDDLSNYSAKLLRRQKVIESRTLDIAKGEERLREVNQLADKIIKERIKDKKLPSSILLLLLQPWSHYLSFILFRNKPSSKEWQKAVATVDDIIFSVTPKEQISEREKQKALQADILNQISRGFEAIGYDPVKSQTLVNGLKSVQDAIYANQPVAPAAPSLRSKLEALSNSKNARLSSSNQDQEAVDLTLEERRLVESLKMVEFGTWVEYSEGRRVKIAWFNQNTHEYMLIDQAGKKVAMKTDLELAREMISRKVKIISGSTKSFFERALEGIYSKLNRIEQA